MDIGSFFLDRESTVTLVYFNSSLNPILYCWKIREVKQAVKYTELHSFSLTGAFLKFNTCFFHAFKFEIVVCISFVRSGRIVRI